jgi:hypothetical protein
MMGGVLEPASAEASVPAMTDQQRALPTTVMPRVKRGIQCAVAGRFDHCRLGILYRPLSRTMTAESALIPKIGIYR